MPYMVTRQRQWPDGAPVVEVSKGGLGYCNPDALGAKYPGEMEAYDSPVDAVDVAIAICKAWRKDGEKKAGVAHGATGGMTMPFSPCTFREARQWATEEMERLPKCDRCGAVLPVEAYRHADLQEEMFCSEYCAEESWREDQALASQTGGEP